MVENPIVGNTYRVIGNTGYFGCNYHSMDIGQLVVCTGNCLFDSYSYRAVGADLEQYIYSHDVGQVGIPPDPCYTVYDAIIQWASDRNILDGSTRRDQMVKLVEEIGELAAGIAKGKEDLVKDSIGDALVVLTILAKQSGTSIEECLNLAWNEIKYRKGKMVDGIFIKEGNQ